MSLGRTLRIRDVGAYLGVSHQRADQMFHEGKFPEPARIDGIGPIWKPTTIEAGPSVLGGGLVGGGGASRPVARADKLVENRAPTKLVGR